MLGLAFVVGAPACRSRGGAWWATPDRLLDGVAPSLVLAAPSNRFRLPSGDAAIGDLLAVSSAAKCVVGPTGTLDTIAAGAPAWDWSSGRRRLLVEARPATNLCLRSEALLVSPWQLGGWSTTATTLRNGLAGIAMPSDVRFIGLRDVTNSAWVVTSTSYAGQSGRISLSFTTAANCVAVMFFLGRYNAASTATIVQTVSVSPSTAYVLSWYADDLGVGGVQLETGTVPSSYVATTTAAVTRIADDVRLSAAALAAVKATALTVAIRGARAAPGAAGSILRVDDGGSTSARTLVFDASGHPAAESVAGAAASTAATTDVPTTFGLAGRFGASGVGLASAGGAVATAAASGLDPALLTQARIGAGSTGAASNLLVDEIVAWPTFASDAGLVAQARPWS